MTHPKSALLLSSLALSTFALGSTTAAHEDDPKILDRQPAYVGPGYQAGGSPAMQAATSFTASGVSLLSWLPLSNFGASAGNDCWGYVSPSGREYALFGHSDGTGFVDITDPTDPIVVGNIAGPSSTWRDVKTYDEYAYIVSEGGSGIQVVDLGQIDAGQVSLVNTITGGGSTTATHNVAIDTTSGFLYRCGGGSEGLRIYSLANPANPSFVTSWSTRYVHDAQIHTYTSGPFAGRQIAFASSGFNGGFTNTGIDVLDVTNKQNIQVLSNVTWPGAAYSHQCWLSDDGTILYVNDELDEDGFLPTTTFILDVSDLNDAFLAGSFTNGNPAVGHNLYVRDNLIYEANYRSGMRVFDATNPLNPVETAFFDTYLADDSASFNGLWSVYPFFPSGIVIGSDMEGGLFVWFMGDPLISFDFPAGVPELVDPLGGTIPVDLTEVTPGDLVPGSATFHYDVGAGLISVPMADLGGGSFEAELPDLACRQDIAYYFSAQSTNGITWRSPDAGGNYTSTAASSSVAIFEDDMETNKGWIAGVPSDDATTGIWTRVDPNGTGAQPEDDHTPAGTLCFVTGNASQGSSIGTDDVDDGTTTLVTPLLDATGFSDPAIKYWRWYSNTGGASPGADTFVIDISNDNGDSWTNVEIVGPSDSESSGGWFESQFLISDLVTPTNEMRVRFRASDLGSGSIVEAAVDDFEVIEFSCDPLLADLDEVSLAAGGTQNLVLDAGSSFGSGLYALAVSAAGSTPGTPVGNVVVPLVADAFTVYSVGNPNSPPFSGFQGFLDGLGQGSATITFAPGSSPGLVGLTFTTAYIVVGAGTGTVDFASNAVTLDLQP